MPTDEQIAEVAAQLAAALGRIEERAFYGSLLRDVLVQWTPPAFTYERRPLSFDYGLPHEPAANGWPYLGTVVPD